jgi:ABC-type Mn2+/Zn2+ transport system permease subunit
LFAAVLAAMIIASDPASWGVTLTAASLVILPVIARPLTDSVRRACSWFRRVGLPRAVGTVPGYELDIASGASIVLLSAGQPVVTLLFVTGRQWLRRGGEAGAREMSAAERLALFD